MSASMPPRGNPKGKVTRGTERLVQLDAGADDVRVMSTGAANILEGAKATRQGGYYAKRDLHALGTVRLVPPQTRSQARLPMAADGGAVISLERVR
jgi:hypothetical protein